MATYQLVLNEGLNAVSTPLLLSGSNAEWTTILSGVAFNSIRTVKDGQWLNYIRGNQSALNDFTTMELGYGYLIDVVRLGQSPEVTAITPANLTLVSMAKGSAIYSDDTTILLGDTPVINQASLWLQTAQSDATDTSAIFAQFESDRATEVFVAYDTSATTLPSWLSSWNKIEQVIYTTDTISYNLYSKIFPAGTVVIPGNQNGGGDATNMYLILMNEKVYPIYVTTPADTQVVKMQEGMEIYTDTTEAVTDIPEAYESFEWIKLADADRTDATSGYLSFSISDESNVYVGYPSDAVDLPTWLTSFIQLPDLITTSSGSLRLYKKYYTAGNITLGGASEGVTTPSANYIVAIENLNPPQLAITLTGAEPSGINDIPITGNIKGGLSFIGMPKGPSADMTIESILDARGLQYKNVWRLNRGLWESYVPDRDIILNWAPAEFERGKGYLIVSSIDEDQTLEIEYAN